jgi:hypothetical protein
MNHPCKAHGMRSSQSSLRSVKQRGGGQYAQLGKRSLLSVAGGNQCLQQLSCPRLAAIAHDGREAPRAVYHTTAPDLTFEGCEGGVPP